MCVLSGLTLSPRAIDHIIGIVKAYSKGVVS